MSPEKKTKCVCENPGWCERHGISKSKHMHHLCQTNPKYFTLWENGVGPGQDLAKDPTLVEEDEEWAHETPDMLTELEVEAFKDRLAICECCPSYMGNHRCSSIQLGCRKAYKKKLRDANCPLDRWKEK